VTAGPAHASGGRPQPNNRRRRRRRPGGRGPGGAQG
jgi:hypothetical protein